MKAERPTWTVITVAYNSSAHLRHNWEVVASRSYRWIVVDNASTDGSADLAAELGATVIRSSQNLGFSAANNLGLAQVDTENVIFVNPDVRLVGDELEKMRTTYGGVECMVAPQLLNVDGTEQPNARGVPTVRQKLANRGITWGALSTGMYSRIGIESPSYIAWAMGAAIGGKTDTFRRLDGWDDDFFLYYEDHDLGLRGWRQGVPTVLDPSVRWVHGWERATAGPDIRAWMREVPSAVRFYRKYPWAVAQSTAERPAGYAQMRRLLWCQASS